MLSKKAQIEDVLHWFFYITITAMVIYIFVIVPLQMLNNSIQPIALDAAIGEERLFNKLSAYSPVMGMQNGVATNSKNSAVLYLGEKAYGYRVEAGIQVIYTGNNEFYEDAIALIPVKYRLYAATKTYYWNGKEFEVLITQVFPNKYKKMG